MRERCSLVFEKARRNELNHFTVDMSKFEDATRFVVSIIKVTLVIPVCHISCINFLHSAILHPIMRLSHPTVDGNISMSAAKTVSHTSFNRGHRLQLTLRSGLDD